MPNANEMKIRTVFGNEVDFSEIEGLNINEILHVEQDLMKVDNGDPNYVYGWMNTRDPACAVKLRKGLWEIVTPENSPEVVSGAIWDEKEYRINELVLVRMPLRRWRQLSAAIAMKAAHRESAIQERYRETAEVLGSKNPLISEDESTMTNEQAIRMEKDLADQRAAQRRGR